MPDYKIIIHLKFARPKEGVRWHPSYDIDLVRNLVTEKAYKTIGRKNIDLIEVALEIRTAGPTMKTKNL